MSLTREDLDRLDQHWAVLAVGDTEHGLHIADMRLVQKAVGDQVNLAFKPEPSDDDLLQRLALAYETAAIEGLDSFLSLSITEDDLRKQCIAGAFRAFELRRLFTVPEASEARIFHVLHLSALAYCGDRWSDMRRWFDDNTDSLEITSNEETRWDVRVLYSLFECWIRLFRKDGWSDLSGIGQIITRLREEQSNYESDSLDSGVNAHDRAMALRLIAFYNWAKGTELLAIYVMQGRPRGINALLDKHFEAATEAAALGGDPQLEILVRWLHAASRQMISGSLWWVAHAINSRVTRFVGSLTQQQAMFELLPPQRAAIQQQGLLDQAATAVVVDLPTSGGKTLLAQFRILQALNQFAEEGGWVAYVVPTRALSSQITRRLRRDFSPIGVQVEQLTGALEVDAIEEELLRSEKTGSQRTFDVLVVTPEKLQIVIRNKKVQRPLSLLVLDEAHNMESETRGMRIELLLATVKQESEQANFLLLMPFVERAEVLARWLANDPSSGRSISLGTSIWKPNERLVGTFKAEADKSVPAGWKLQYETLVTTPKTIHLGGVHQVGKARPLDIPKSAVINADGSQKGFGLQAAAMATTFSARGTCIAVGGTIPNVWSMARAVSATLPEVDIVSEPLRLVQNFLREEISPDFELISMLSRGVAVHHAGLSDEVRSLVEWLAEENDLRVLCTTTTVAQGINFPVSSVFLATYKYPYGVEMSPREFWNLAGRAGRMNQDSVGVVGIAEANNRSDIIDYVKRATGELVSRLVTIVASLDEASTPEELLSVIQQEQWEDFRCYVTHLVHETGHLEQMIANTELSLRNTYGYRSLQESPEGRVRAQKLLEATKQYAQKISRNPGQVAQADMTGFSYEGVGRALIGVRQLERSLTVSDFEPNRLFGNADGIADLYGVMLMVPQLKRNLDDLIGPGKDHKQLAGITQAWVDGRSIQDIAAAYFGGNENPTNAISKACRAVYRNIANNGTWGLSAISRLSGIDFESLSPTEKRQIDLLPAMIYHGVKTEEGVLMRMNGVPRSIAERMGKQFKALAPDAEQGSSIVQIREFLSSADMATWNRVRKPGAALSGAEYKRIWGLISGESR